jgi:3-deoxy-D-arabino-heptulosonate 7-phosphate (DAHP) synthase class II
MTKLKVMKGRAIELLDDIEANVSVCCAITMEPDEVLELIEELRGIVNKMES